MPSSPCACTALRKASRAVTRLYDAALADAGLTTTQFAILRNLARAENAALPLSQLASILVMDRTSLYRTLTPMERGGWVVVVEGEGRSKIATLTDAGHSVMAAGDAGWEAAQSRVGAVLAPGEWEAMLATLARLQQVAPA